MDGISSLEGTKMIGKSALWLIFLVGWKLLQEQGMNMIDYGGAEITKAHSR